MVRFLNLKNGRDDTTQALVQEYSERSFSLVWAAEGQPIHESSEFSFWVDASMKELFMWASAVKDLPVVSIADPDGSRTN